MKQSDTHDFNVIQGSKKSYLMGFVLSLILTVIPFWLIMEGIYEGAQLVLYTVLTMAVIQIIVHLVYFLHMNRSSEQFWNVCAFIFTIIVISIIIIGSIWIMHHLDHNMMRK